MKENLKSYPKDIAILQAAQDSLAAHLLSSYLNDCLIHIALRSLVRQFFLAVGTQWDNCQGSWSAGNRTNGSGRLRTLGRLTSSTSCLQALPHFCRILDGTNESLMYE